MMRSNIKIAITGGIGSGKSAVSDIIREQGFPVISCDEIYGELIEKGGLTQKIAEVFDGVLTANGRLDKKKLSEIVFDNPSALEKLNSVTHPEIMKAVFGKLKNYELGFCEVPLLFENGLQNSFDGVIVVLRNEEDRIKSVMERDSIDRLSVQKRIKSQFNYNNCNFAKYYVIHNCLKLSDLRQNTLQTLEKIKEKYLKNL